MQRNGSCRANNHRAEPETRPLGRGQPSLLDPIAVVSSCRGGQEIVRGKDSADGWYSIVGGAVRRCAIRPDGKRQIIDLLLPGDVFCTTPIDAQVFTVEAVVDGTTVAFYPRNQVYLLAESDSRVARQVCEMALAAMSRLHHHILVLGRTTTREKVASFLLRISERLASGPANRIELPMSRYDIADYLAISVETVSRSMTGLRRSGAIALNGARRVHITDRDALEDGEREPDRDVECETYPQLAAEADHRRANSKFGESPFVRQSAWRGGPAVRRA